MKKIFKSLSSVLITAVCMCVLCVPINAMKYTDGRFIKNTQVHECLKKIVMQHEDYKELCDGYSVHPERICFSFSVKKKTNKVQSIGIIVPVAYGYSARSFHIKLKPRNDLSSFDLVLLFLNSNRFNEENFDFDADVYIILESWEPDNENEYDNKYSIITDITEDNWQEKFSDKENVIPDLCPGSLMFFEIRPGEKVFVEGYAH